MKPAHFDRLAHSRAGRTSRRGFLTVITGLAVGVADHRIGVIARGKKARTPKPNAYGCLEVGQACQGQNTRCCSGVCQGKKPKKGRKDRSRCVAHDDAGCQPEQDSCNVGIPCGPGASCYRTTGDAGFCGDTLGVYCQDCKDDADCVTLGHGQDAACIVCSLCAQLGGTACVAAAP